MPIAPETIKIDGQIWNRIQPVERQEQLLLSRHFGNNPSLAENPIFRGTMAIYQAENGHRRFYWLSRLESDVAWLHLEFDKLDRFVGMREGSGVPFNESST